MACSPAGPLECDEEPAEDNIVLPLDYPHADSKHPAIRRGCVELKWGTYATKI